MNELEFKRRFPNASAATVAANCEVRPTKSKQSKKALVAAPKREALFASRPCVRFTICHRQSFDPDNKYSAVKNLLDGLAFAHLIIGDSEKQIELEVTQRIPFPGEEPHTLIEIYYA